MYRVSLDDVWEKIGSDCHLFLWHVYGTEAVDEGEGGCSTPVPEVSRIREEGPGVYYVLDTQSPHKMHKHYGNVYWQWLTSFPQCPTEEECELVWDRSYRQHGWNNMKPITIDEVVPMPVQMHRKLLSFTSCTPPPSPSKDVDTSIDNGQSSSSTVRHAQEPLLEDKEVDHCHEAFIDTHVTDTFAGGEEMVSDVSLGKMNELGESESQVENSVVDPWDGLSPMTKNVRQLLHKLFPIPPRYVPPMNEDK